ncbi:MAG: hypothetical protein OXF49_03065 [Candidatus Saccharibacteria bacterium]|nr:hypothetical protein [Candidatus Saccharibacteria bacterium]
MESQNTGLHQLNTVLEVISYQIDCQALSQLLVNSENLSTLD